MCMGRPKTPDTPTPAQPIKVYEDDPKKLNVESDSAAQKQKKNRNKLKISNGDTGANTSSKGSGLKTK